MNERKKVMKDFGKKQWLIADGYMSDSESGEYVSHEAVCVLNLTDESAEIKITVYFEDREPLKGFSAECQPERTNHIRLDRIINSEGKSIPKNIPYALLIESDVPVVCQHSRMDVSKAEMTLMTTMAY